jgi:DNA mismatch repair ATPase MutS
MEYEKSLHYSFDFEGFLCNLQGLFENLTTNKIGIAEFFTDLSGNSLSIKDQYYPALINETFVSNDAIIDKNMIITGPNAAGKTTYLKTTVINIIFTQQFGCGFYSACKMKPYTHIHSYLNIPDTSGRDSLFQAESRRCKEILNVITDSNEKSRHFGIFDELYSGTNPIEATKSAYSFLLYLSKIENVDFILTTHYVDICSRLTKASTRIENWKMDAKMDENGDIEYNYTISKGISTIQGAVKVLRDMEYPEEIIQTIIDYDNETEKEKEKKQVVETKKSRKSKK